jgi:hypothetical protein
VAATDKRSAGAKKPASKTPSATAKKRTARRADFGAPIGPWFEQWPPEKRAPLEKLRAIIDATVPEAESGLKWSVPFWTLNGKQLCDLVALKHEVALGIFAPPDVFDDPQGQLSGKSKEYRVLKVKHASEIDDASVKRWLEAAVAAQS